jgi:hypothetical protein
VRRQRTAESWTDRWTELRHGAVERSRRRTNAPLRQGIWASAPPGTRTPNPRIESPEPGHIVRVRLVPARVVSAGQQRAAGPSDAVQCRPGPRPPSTDGAPRPAVGAPSTDQVGGASTAQAADLGSAGSVVAVTRTVARCGRIGGCRPRRSRTAGWVVQPTGGVEKTNAIESRAAVRALRRSAVVDPVPPLCRLSVGAFLQGGRGAARRPVPSSDRRPPPPSTRRRQTDDVAIRYGT